MATASSSTSVVSSLLQMGDDELKQCLEQNAKFKIRSQTTTNNTHFIELRGSRNAIDENETSLPPLDTVLLGDSMMERFKTTGRQFKFPGEVFNGGVGGDKIQNLIYRLHTLDLFTVLSQRTIDGIIFINIGTNNLKPNNKLPESDIKAYAVLLVALCREFQTATIIVSGILPRTGPELDVKNGIPKEYVDDANARFAAVVREIGQVKKNCVWMPPPNIDLNQHLADHVHLNKQGYTIWFKQIQKLME